MQAGGDTSIWDALALANDRLSTYAHQNPEVRKRIVCLSDGQDTSSKNRSWEVCSNLVQNGIIVDSFCIGAENNVDLKTISLLTGGYKFVPKSLEQAMAICEMEPVLTQLDRPSRTVQLQGQPVTSQSFLAASSRATADIVTQDIFPGRKQHPNLSDSFVSISDASRMPAKKQRRANQVKDRMQMFALRVCWPRSAMSPSIPIRTMRSLCLSPIWVSGRS